MKTGGDASRLTNSQFQYHAFNTIPTSCIFTTDWDVICLTLAFIFKPNPRNKRYQLKYSDRQVLMKKALLPAADHTRWIDMIRGGSGEGGWIFTDFGPLGLISKFLRPGELHTPPIGPLY